jgi:hypothetical protein
MKYTIESEGGNVNITIEKVGGYQKRLMEELKECAEGRCSCQTPEYKKVESMQVKPEGDKVDITLKAKAGEKIDQGDINKCLEHTTKKAEKCC